MSKFISLLSFSGSLATKFIYLINEECFVRPTFTELN